MSLYEIAEDAYLARAGSVSTNGIGAAVDAIEPLIRADEEERLRRRYHFEERAAGDSTRGDA